MRKVIGVGAVLLLAGAVMAPANAAQSADLAPVAVVQTVAVEADPVAVVDFESPTVIAVAAPVVEAETVGPVAVANPVAETPTVPVEPVQAPSTPVVEDAPTVKTGGTVTETETETPVEVVPEVPAAPEPEQTEPEPVVPTPEPTEEVPLVLEGDRYTYNEFDPAFWQYDVNLTTGEKYAGSYVGTFYARDKAFFTGTYDLDNIRQQPGVEFHPDMNPLGTDVFYVFHVWSGVAE